MVENKNNSNQEHDLSASISELGNNENIEKTKKISFNQNVSESSSVSEENKTSKLDNLTEVSIDQLDGVYRNSDPVIKDVISEKNIESVDKNTPIIPTKDTKTENISSNDEDMEKNDITQKTDKRGTQSLGLLLLRLVIGGLLIFSGYEKLFGNFGLSQTEDLLFDNGFSYPEVLAIVYGVGQLSIGVFLALGLATPLVASLASGLSILEYMVIQKQEAGFQLFSGIDGNYAFEYKYLLIFVSIAIVLTGPGVISLDIGRKWTKRPFLGSVFIMLSILALTILFWITFNGQNIF